MATTCECCGQTCIPSDAWTIRGYCEDCRAGQYGAGEEHERSRLFEPAATQLPGQTRMEVDPSCRR